LLISNFVARVLTICPLVNGFLEAMLHPPL